VQDELTEDKEGLAVRPRAQGPQCIAADNGQLIPEQGRAETVGVAVPLAGQLDELSYEMVDGVDPAAEGLRRWQGQPGRPDAAQPGDQTLELLRREKADRRRSHDVQAT
jgi:hypothetical protein